MRMRHGLDDVILAPSLPAGAVRPAELDLLFQGLLTPAELDLLFQGLLTPADLDAVLAHLQHLDYLQPGRLGDWRHGPRLNDLLNRQASAHCPLSIYSNIQGGEGRTVDIRDQHTQQTVVRVDPQWLDRPVLTLVFSAPAS